MSARRPALAATVGVALLAATAITTVTGLPAVAAPDARPHPMSTWAGAGVAAGVHERAVCPHVKGEASCSSVRLEDAAGEPVAPDGRRLTEDPALHGDDFFDGYSPSQVQQAYGISGLASGGRTVAVVAGYGYRRAEADLAVYRERFGLPACTVASGCLTILDQRGGTALPAENPRWADEQALDLDAVSAACPDCKLVLVQADNALPTNLAEAVDTAARRPGVVAISNSYTAEGVSDELLGAHFDHPGIAITAATGDEGYKGPVYPASSAHVTAVGGTMLIPDTSAPRGFKEFVWSGSGSGCLEGQAAPTGQDPAVTGCKGRAVADVAAVAEPATGLATYGGRSAAWSVKGGTSLATPLVAAMYALAGPPAGRANAAPYAHPDGFYDITAGHNGTCGRLCTGQAGWDGPSGVGSPHGISGLRG